MDNKHKENTVISWKAPEFFHYKKGNWWFPLLALVVLVLTALFILTKQYLVAIIVVLGGIVIYRLAHQEPEVIPVTFTTKSIEFKGRSLLFDEIKNFWLIESEASHVLYLQTVERFSRPIVIPLIKADVEKVRDFLSQYAPEEKEPREDLADRINRWLRI